MSVLIKAQFLTEDQISNIQKDLTLIPIDPYDQERKKRNKSFQEAPKEHIQVYTVERKNDEVYVRIPFSYGCYLQKRLCNREKNFPLADEKEVEFKAKLRDKQIGYVNECFSHLKQYGTSTLQVPPGDGKTIMGAYLWHLSRLMLLVYVHRDKIAEAWLTTFNKCFPQISDRVWTVGENQPIKNGKLPLIIICMDGRFDKIPQNIREAVGFVIIDEAHALATKTRISCLLGTEPKFVLAETATLERKDGMHGIIKAIVGDHGVFKMSDKPHTVIRLRTFFSCELPKNKNGDTSFTDLQKLMAADERRNSIAVDIVKCNPTHKFMILTRLRDHAELIALMVEAAGIQCGRLYGTKKDYSDSPVLVGTISKMGTGFDEENACKDFKGVKSDVLIIMTSIKDISLYEQVKGRIRDKHPYIFYLVDENRISKMHFKNTVRQITETNGNIIELDYLPGNVILPPYGSV